MSELIISSTNQPLVHRYTAQANGSCNGATIVSGGLHEVTPGIGRLTWFGVELYCVSVDDELLFQPVVSKADCLQQDVECGGEDCRSYSIDTIIAIVVIGVILVSAFLGFVIWQRKRYLYRSV
eukprot:TRINITY_DN5400_c0_g1_i3.p1 TRINITY_DN5400_c0_g1~~TRINITY_DN5400_c0_g1_i3.p1  ORF type:complete len:123 (-),score=19.16 TRINITY_DN5400_c0_g1_i3:25-393(-)